MNSEFNSCCIDLVPFPSKHIPEPPLLGVGSVLRGAFHLVPLPSPLCPAQAGSTLPSASAASKDQEDPVANLLVRLCTTDQLNRDDDGVLPAYVNQLQVILSTYVDLVVLPDSAAGLWEIVKQHPVVKLTEDGDQPTAAVGCFYFIQASGESDTMPHVRMPRFRADNLKLFWNALSTPSGQASMPARTHWFVCDAGRGGNEDSRDSESVIVQQTSCRQSSCLSF